jgi:hypothetical protein
MFVNILRFDKMNHKIGMNEIAEKLNISSTGNLKNKKFLQKVLLCTFFPCVFLAGSVLTCVNESCAVTSIPG